MDKYFTVTGNPFVDTGVYAITELAQKDSPTNVNIDDVKDIIEKLSKAYFSENWKRSLHSVFPNSTITHNRIKSADNFKEMMNDLIEEMLPLEKSGHCVICGKRKIFNKSIYKDKIPLIGSGELLNFFPAANKGLDLCSGCVLAIQCMPLLMQKCGGMYSILHSNSASFMRAWSKVNVEHINVQIATGSFDGPVIWEHGNPYIALIEGATEVINKFEDEIEEGNIDLYHFSNYNQGPNLALYKLPSNIFIFLIKLTRKGLQREWYSRIVTKGYPRNKKGELNKKQNQVYENLLQGKSILHFFVGKRVAACSWELLETYLMEVKKLDRERLGNIKAIGDELANVIKKSGKTKRLGDLERTKNYNEILLVLFKITKEGIKQGNIPLTYDEITNVLFPEGYIGWRETKYLLLFRIYEQLNEWLSKKNIELEEIIVEEE